MKQRSFSHPPARSGAPDPAWGILITAGLLAALVLALPALPVGLLAQRLTRGRTWSTLLWLILSILSAGLLFVLVVHGTSQLIQAQFAEIARNARLYQANLMRWDRSTLWLRTWPLWVRSLVLAPGIALWGDLSSARSGGIEALLQRQKDRTQRNRARAHERSARRAHDPGCIPDAVAGQMVMGIALADEDEP